MKSLLFNSLKVGILTTVAVVFFSCERDLSDDAEFATFSKAAEMFTDDFIGMGEDFYKPFVQDGAKPDVFSVDSNEGFESSASIRIDVPNANDPSGGFAGAIFLVDGPGRNLTDYTALTFYAKANQASTIELIGFGEGDYQVSVENMQFTTNWQKYIIPIPDPSKLINERGMLFFSDGTNETNGLGYTFWLDEIKFENLGGIGQARPAIMNGQDVERNSFNGVTTDIVGLTQTFNLGNGQDITVNAAPKYYSFTSSDSNVAIVNERGNVSVLSAGVATISAQLAGVAAQGSLTLNSLGDFASAPTPTQDPANVISIFSDAYTNVPVDYYNGFFAPFQTTLGGAIAIGDENVISYTNLNFVAIGTFMDVPSVDATAMTHVHVDINVQEAIDSGDYINFQLNNSIGNNETDGSVRIEGADLVQEQWVSFDFPLSDFAMSDQSQLGLYFFISEGTISNIFVDNLYFYQQ